MLDWYKRFQILRKKEKEMMLDDKKLCCMKVSFRTNFHPTFLSLIQKYFHVLFG